MLLLPGPSLILLTSILTFSQGPAQPVPVSERLLSKPWNATWISPGNVSLSDYGVFHFRNAFQLEALPESLVIHVSADNRFKLFVNGKPVAKGPSRDDLLHWRFDSLDIRPFLNPGRNVIAAAVWNAGERRPMAQESLKTAFIVQADDPRFEAILNTGPQWNVFHNPAYQPLGPDYGKLQTYIVVGPGDRVDGALYPWGWEQPEFDDSGWASPRVLSPGLPRGAGTDITWQLTPRSIPPMEETVERLQRVVRVSGVPSPDPGFLGGNTPLTIPANTRATLLLDHGRLTMGHPVLQVSDGMGASIRLSYAEALVDAKRRKGNRNETEGKTLIGLEDLFLADGGWHREYTPLWIRTFRYLQMDIETGEAPLTIKDIHSVFFGYPFRDNAFVKTDDPELEDIWSTSWRTARLCAGETYFDCPYYEQLMYVGDTRIQALISLYVSGDDRLVRKAIELFDHSRFDEGLTRSRYPSHEPQVIPTYSLFWINMVHDTFMHRPDVDFVRERRLGLITVLDWYEKQINPETGLVGDTPYWNFVDWAEEWPWNESRRKGGVPDLRGGSSILSLQLAYALDDAAALFEAFGEPYFRNKYKALSSELKQAVRLHCWNEERGLFADTPAHETYSQHANIFAILTDTIQGPAAQKLLHQVRSDPDLIQATFYFKFYLFQAMYKTGMGDDYLKELEPWRDMLDLGLTTFAEKPDPTRSDCHAWSASPNYDLLATVCGIRPASPGFKTVSIRPHLGSLKEIDAAMPHPSGPIHVKYRRNPWGLHAEIDLPPGLEGTFTWGGKTYPLKPGSQQMDLKD